MWATFNEINVMTFCGYLYGHFPPAKILHYSLAGRNFLNMLRAHTAAYKAIKSLPGELPGLSGVHVTCLTCLHFPMVSKQKALE